MITTAAMTFFPIALMSSLHDEAASCRPFGVWNTGMSEKCHRQLLARLERAQDRVTLENSFDWTDEFSRVARQRM